MTREQLQTIHDSAQSALRELVDLLNHTPHLATEIKPLMQASDILAAFQELTDNKREMAEQLLRMALATTVNYHTTIEIRQQMERLED